MLVILTGYVAKDIRKSIILTAFRINIYIIKRLYTTISKI